MAAVSNAPWKPKSIFAPPKPSHSLARTHILACCGAVHAMPAGLEDLAAVWQYEEWENVKAVTSWNPPHVEPVYGTDAFQFRWGDRQVLKSAREHATCAGQLLGRLKAP